MPANDNIDPDEAWKRAELLLEAYAKIATIEIHPYDHPGPSIRGLMTDLMHYCTARNVGASKDAPDHLDFDALTKDAKTEYQAQRHKQEMVQSDVRPEMHKHDLKQGDIVIFSKVAPSSYLTPGEEFRVQEVGKNAVYFRNLEHGTGTSEQHWYIDRFAEFTVSRHEERSALTKEAGNDLKNVDSPETARRHREAARAAELRAEIEADERAKQREIEQGLRND